MTNDADWVEDVRRWCLAGKNAPGAIRSAIAPVDSAVAELGCEAAPPARQSLHWPDAPRSHLGELK